MPLSYPPEWKFGSDGVNVPPSLVDALFDLVVRISSGTQRPQVVVERFKSRFGSTSSSSSLDWARSDLKAALHDNLENGAVFCESYWLAVEDVQKLGVVVPTAQQLNDVFIEHGFPYRLAPPRLLRQGLDFVVDDEASSSDDPAPMMPYTLERQIGQGGFGVVYVASRASSIARFEFALKLLDPSPFIEDHGRATARFSREVQAVQRLQHRGIVPYIDAGLDQHGRPYLVMPLIDGVELREAAEKMPFERRVAAMIEILDAVAHAHALAVLHRDLKPSNILVRQSDDQPIVVDFGLSYIIDVLNSETLTSSAAGSAGYLPSEVLADPGIRSPKQDIYACGVILYETLASFRPDPANYRPLEIVHANLTQLDPIIKQAIAASPNRYANAGDFRDDLRDALSAMSVDQHELRAT